MKHPVEEAITALETAIDYRFANRALLREALTHRSYLNEHTDVERDNERLEFLGDAVLGCVITHLLWSRMPSMREGPLTRYRATLVSEKALSGVASTIGLGTCLLLGRGEEMSGGRAKPSLLANAFESLVAAVFEDGGFERVYAMLERLFDGELGRLTDDPGHEDYKTRAQELAQAVLRLVPSYRVVETSGPEHEKRFHVAVRVSGVELARGWGRSKKAGEQAAAREFCRRAQTEPALLKDIAVTGQSSSTD